MHRDVCARASHPEDRLGDRDPGSTATRYEARRATELLKRLEITTDLQALGVGPDVQVGGPGEGAGHWPRQEDGGSGWEVRAASANTDAVGGKERGFGVENGGLSGRSREVQWGSGPEAFDTAVEAVLRCVCVRARVPQSCVSVCLCTMIRVSVGGCKCGCATV